MTLYELINPRIVGTFKSEYKVEKPEEAAKECWENLSKHLTNNVPKLFITFQKEDGKLFHFKIQEKPNNKFAEYTIKEVKLNLTKDEQNDLIKKSLDIKNNIETQAGGSINRHKVHKNKDDSNSDSSSDSDTSSLSSPSDTSDISDFEVKDDGDDYFDFQKFKRATTQPIVHWWYAPTIYKVGTIFTPTFTIPLTPYVQLWMPY